MQRGWTVSSRIAAVLCLFAALAAPSHAHEVQPSVADLTIDGREITLDIETILEPVIAGVDLGSVRDTDDAAEAGEVDRLRALSPGALEDALRATLLQLLGRIKLMSGDIEIDLTLDQVRIPPPGNTDLPRVSGVILSGALPPGDAPVTLNWDPSLGALVLRQMGAGQDGYTGYLQSGGMSDPIPRTPSRTFSPAAAFVAGVPEGFERIVPRGFAHAAFILGIFLVSATARALIYQVLAFTLSHIAGMAAAIFGGILAAPGLLAALVPLSLVYIGLAAIFARSGISAWHLGLVSLSGMVHGLTLGAVLRADIAAPSPSLASFAGWVAGIELSQIAILLVAFLALGLRFPSSGSQHRQIVQPAGIAIALFGGGLLAENLLF